MKKKIIFAIATSLFAVATVFNMNLLQVNKAGDISLDAITVMAQAQNSEHVPSSLTWEHVADALNAADNWFYGGKYKDYYNGRTYNNDVTDVCHAFCDLYDISGDPVYSKTTGRQIDDCDGQPNFC